MTLLRMLPALAAHLTLSHSSVLSVTLLSTSLLSVQVRQRVYGVHHNDAAHP
jgi:hypothetical protein